MFLAVHATVGALAGASVTHPSEAFVLGFVSHFFLDMIPHGDEIIYQGYVAGTKVRRAVLYVMVDALVTAALVGLVFLKQDFFYPVNVWLGIVGGLLPDLLVGLAQIIRPKRTKGLVWRLDRFQKFHRWNHVLIINKWRKFQRDIPLYAGMMLQVLVLVLLVRLIT